MESYGLSNVLNQQEGLTNEDRAKGQFLQEQINEAMTRYTNKNNREEDKSEAAEGEVIGGFSGEVMDAAAKVKGLNKAIEAGYTGTYDNLAQQAQKAAEGLEPVGEALGSAARATGRAAVAVGGAVSEIPAGAARLGLLGQTQKSKQLFADYGDRLRRQADAEREAEEAGAATDAPAQATGEAAGATGAGEAGGVATGAADAAAAGEEAASGLATTAKVAAEVGGRLAGGAMGVGQLGLDIYKQVEGGGFMKGGVNTGDDIGNITNEVGSTIDIIGAATGDPALMLAGVGVGLVGSAISGISELFHHEETKNDKPKAPDDTPADPIAVESLAGQGGVAQTQQSSLKQIEVGAG